MPTSLVFLPKEGAPCPDLVSGRPAGGSSRGRGRSGYRASWPALARHRLCSHHFLGGLCTEGQTTVSGWGRHPVMSIGMGVTCGSQPGDPPP